LKNRKVVVVDDDIDLRDTLGIILEDMGYEPVLLGGGQQALSWLRSNPAPLVVLLDLMMPGMSGQEFLRIHSRDEKLSAIQVVVVSASHDLKNDFKEGSYIQKPFDLKRIKKILDAIK
jgi:DNA-binding NtrC family response regulator